MAKSEPQLEEKGNDFNPLEAFDREQGLPQFIPRNLLEKQIFSIECAAGEDMGRGVVSVIDWGEEEDQHYRSIEFRDTEEYVRLITRCIVAHIHRFDEGYIINANAAVRAFAQNYMHAHQFQPDPKQFKLTSGLLLVAVPPFMNPPLEFGDYVISVDDEVVKDKHHFYQIIKDLSSKKAQKMMKISVERVISSVQVPKSDPSVPSDITSSQRCDYFKNTMIFFPRSSLGINIKSVNKKVYVESTDNGFNSIARRAFYIGDALLAVNGTKCTSVKQAGGLLVNALKAKGIAQVLIERPVEPAAVAFVRAVLLVNKKNVMDPKMPDDVIVICKKELQRMRKEANIPAKEILKEARSHSFSEPKQRERARVKIAETVTEVGIGMEMFNPALLEHVPPMENRGKDI